MTHVSSLKTEKPVYWKLTALSLKQKKFLFIITASHGAENIRNFFSKQKHI